MTISVHRRLLIVATLSAIACTGAVLSMVRLWQTGTEQRLERAREAVLLEVDRLRDADEAGLFRTGRRGPRLLQSGYLDGTLRERGGSPGRANVPPAVVAALTEAAQKSSTGDEGVVREVSLPNATLVLAVLALRRGGFAWALMRVLTPHELPAWRLGVLVMALTSLALVLASLQAMVAYKRDATSLQAALSALGRDLRAQVPRPAVRELQEVGRGISALAADLARAQEEQQRLHRELAEQERLASLGRVAAGLAHEVRNPLAAIKLRVDLAQRAPGLPAALLRDLCDISAEVARLDRLMTDLLTVAGRRTGPLLLTDLCALVRQRIGLMRPWIDEQHGSGMQVQVEGAASARIAPDAVARVIDNLLRNAVQASPAGQAVEVTLGQDENLATLTVSDRGPGVPAGRQPELFEPFFTTKPEGTGLGLALSRSVALAHGGSLSYERDLLRTRFLLRLPR